VNLTYLVRKTLRIYRKPIRLIRNITISLERKEWKRYHCGNYTDLDECRCPAHGLECEPSKTIKMWGWQIRILTKRGRVWTKYPSRWWP